MFIAFPFLNNWYAALPQGYKLDSYDSWNFWRFDLEIPVDEGPKVIEYSVDVDPGRTYSFHMAGKALLVYNTLAYLLWVWVLEAGLEDVGLNVGRLVAPISMPWQTLNRTRARQYYVIACISRCVALKVVHCFGIGALPEH